LIDLAKNNNKKPKNPKTRRAEVPCRAYRTRRESGDLVTLVRELMLVSCYLRPSNGYNDHYRP
jgi:hypothetical protein